MSAYAYERPRYHPATTKADWIAYSERLEVALAERDAENERLRKRLFKAESFMKPKGAA